jgi:hypothetical protein
MTFLHGSYSNYMLAFLILFLGFFVQVLFLNVIFSLAFFTKGLVTYLFKMYYQNLNTLVESYTPKFFEQSKFVHFVYLFPVSFIDYFYNCVHYIKSKHNVMYLNIENISNNNIIINHLIRNKPYISITVYNYYFYNFIYRPQLSEETFILC